MSRKVNVFIVKNFILERINNDEDTKQKRNNPNCFSCNNSTKLLVPRNGKNNEKYKNIEKRGNFLYNIDYVT